MPVLSAKYPGLKITAAVVIAAALSGLAFAGWMNNGAEILITMAEAGLAWCF